MKTCTVCRSNITSLNKMKSLFTKYGDIKCDNCNSVFRLNQTKLRKICFVIAALMGGLFAVFVDGYKGVLFGTLFILLIAIIELYMGKYTLVKKS